MTRFFVLIFIFSSVYSQCPHGAFNGPDLKTCYQFHGSDASDFYTSEENCQTNINGHLASISDAFTNANLASTLKQILLNPQMPVWLGGNRITNLWTWTDGKPFTYENWEKGEPKDGNNCLYINPSNGKWTSADCSQAVPYLCEILGNINQNSTSGSCPTFTCPTQKPVILACDPDWTYSNISNSCYKMIYNFNWTSAENECLSMGAHLASIHNLEENQFINEFAKAGINFSDFSGIVYIGLNDLNEIGNWVWTDETPYDYQFWATGQPNIAAITRCGFITPDPTTTANAFYQHWGTTECNSLWRGAVCQKKSNL